MRKQDYVLGFLWVLLGCAGLHAQVGTFRTEVYNDCDITVAPGSTIGSTAIFVDYEATTHSGTNAAELTFNSAVPLCFEHTALDPTVPHMIWGGRTYLLKLYGDAYSASPTTDKIEAELGATMGTHVVFPATTADWSGFYETSSRPIITINRDDDKGVFLHAEFYGKTVTFRVTGCGAPINDCHFVVAPKVLGTEPVVHFVYDIATGASNTLKISITTAVQFHFGHSKVLSSTGTARKVALPAPGGTLTLSTFDQTDVHGHLQPSLGAPLFDVDLDTLGQYDATQTTPSICIKTIRSKRSTTTQYSLLEVIIKWKGRTVILEMSDFS